jgi:hypothetical protein
MRSSRPVTTLLIEMRKRVRDNFIDRVMESYVDWRQESAQVEFAYGRWAMARSTDPAGAFAVYAAALDREELASISYAQIIRRTTVVFERDRRRRVAAAQHRVTRRRPTRRRRRAGARPREAGSRLVAARGRRARS